MVLVKREKTKEAKRLKALLSLVNEGIIALDRIGQIIEINSKGSEYLNVYPPNAINQSITKYIPNISDGVDLKQKTKAKLVTINNSQFILNFRPLEEKGEYLGGLITLEKCVEIQILERKIRENITKKGLVAKNDLDEIVGKSKTIKEAVAWAKKIGKSNYNVLITGESGTGKELFTHGIHRVSSRCNGPFVAVNCATLPENLLESELFGYDEGSFSGAKKGGKLGLFEQADGGTIFLDEIGAINPSIQAGLLRVIEEKEIRRIGGDRNIPVDVRIIAATNEPLETLISESRFRADLFYRINELNLYIPPLRGRKEDIPLLIRHFLCQVNEHNSEVFIEGLFHKICEMVHSRYSNYYWPGNVRELSNFVKRFSIMYLGNDVGNLTNNINIINVLQDRGNDKDKKFDEEVTVQEQIQEEINIKIDTLSNMEQQLITKLVDMNYSKSELARLLNISRSTLWRKLLNIGDA
jgi:transcriptional regulator with PAS, ATPase and Fis domain